MFKEHPDLSTKRRRGPMRRREKVTLKPFREFLHRDATGTLLGGSDKILENNPTLCISRGVRGSPPTQCVEPGIPIL